MIALVLSPLVFVDIMGGILSKNLEARKRPKIHNRYASINITVKKLFSVLNNH